MRGHGCEVGIHHGLNAKWCEDDCGDAEHPHHNCVGGVTLGKGFKPHHIYRRYYRAA